MTEAQHTIYCVGLVVLLSGGISLAAALVALSIGFSCNYLWRKMKEAYTFRQLRKAWVYYHEHALDKEAQP